MSGFFFRSEIKKLISYFLRLPHCCPPTDRVAGRGEVDVGGGVSPARAVESSQVSRYSVVVSTLGILVTGGHLQHLPNTLWLSQCNTGYGGYTY